MPKYHRYKNKSGGYYRGRSRSGRYYTKSGCMLPILSIILLVLAVVTWLL